MATRAELLGVASICDYWERCTQSDDFEHAIHIFSSPLDLNSEAAQVPLNGSVCIDITALFTLLFLGLLDEVLGLFDHWVIAMGTRDTLDYESIGNGTSHPVATKLREWLVGNRGQIRTRKSARAGAVIRNPEKYSLHFGIWVRNERTLADVVGDGVGETLLLAEELKLPLYSDEVSIRIWGAKEFGVTSFSTIALLRRLRNLTRLSSENETSLIVKLIKSNYKYIPFGPEHLQTALENLLPVQQAPSQTEIITHPLLGTLLSEFSDSKMDDLSLFRVATEWVVNLVVNRRVSDRTRADMVTLLSFRISQRVLEGVLTGVSTDKPFRRTAILWAVFLAATYKADKCLLGRCWPAVSTAAQAMIQDEGTRDRALHQWAPATLYRMLKSQDKERLVAALVDVPASLPEPERTNWEVLLLRLAKRDRLVQ